jgi:hypothetical protein
MGKGLSVCIQSEHTKLGVGQTPHILWVLSGASRRALQYRAGETLLY